MDSRTRALGKAAVLALLVGSCGKTSPRPNVVLVTLDTTRADRIGAYGDPDARTPVIDAWGRAGAQVRTAVADVPLTLPSHVTLFTATPALYHGVRTNADRRLGDAAPTLAERLTARGYVASAVVSTVVLDAETGVAQGFARYDDEVTHPYEVQDPQLFPETRHWLPEMDRRADEAMDRAVAELDELARGGAPFFLWIHLYDPHFPYDPPLPWGRVVPAPYDGEIAFVDRQLARLARTLEERGLAGSTALCVMADHGEGLGDHREDEHGILLYDDTLRIPLLVVQPGALPGGRVVPGLVRTVDVAPTLLELAGAKPAFGAGGSLVPALRGAGPVPGTEAYCETVKPRVSYSGSAVKALRTLDRKLIWAPRPELYDLRADPGETRDRAAESPAEVEAMAEQLEDVVLQTLRWRPGWAEARAADPEHLEALRSLGYLPGSGGDEVALTAPAEMDTTGFDPKDLVDVAMAGRDVENGYDERARVKLRRFLDTAASPEDRPEIRPLWSLARQNLGAVELAAGRFGAAVEQFRDALRLEPGNRAVRWELVMTLSLAGRPGEAEREGARMLAADPGAWKVRLHRGMALALLGRRDEAKAELSRVARDCPEIETRSVAALLGGRIGTDREEAALESYRASWRKPPQVTGRSSS
jgi:arylsulfatase A-like enzyme